MLLQGLCPFSSCTTLTPLVVILPRCPFTPATGLFAVEPIEAGEFVIEYCGVRLRKPLDDVRQRQVGTGARSE